MASQADRERVCWLTRQADREVSVLGQTGRSRAQRAGWFARQAGRKVSVPAGWPEIPPCFIVRKWRHDRARDSRSFSSHFSIFLLSSGSFILPLHLPIARFTRLSAPLWRDLVFGMPKWPWVPPGFFAELKKQTNRAIAALTQLGMQLHSTHDQPRPLLSSSLSSLSASSVLLSLTSTIGICMLYLLLPHLDPPCNL